ncbi:MAG: hypothetical protein RLZZ422_2670 [Pseudomonadota bacterium]|jgi:parallel beta-helix repeat protein
MVNKSARVLWLLLLFALSFMSSIAAAANITIETSSPFRDTLKAGQNYTLTYRFSVTAPTSPAQKVFVHFINAAGQIVLQDDHNPPNPTTAWSNTNATLPDVTYSRTKTLPANMAAGKYWIVAGLYNPTTGARMMLDKGYRVAEFNTGSRSYVVAELTVTTRTIRNASFTCADINSNPASWPDVTAQLNADLSAIVSKTATTSGEVYKLPKGGCKYSNILILYNKVDVEIAGKGIPDTQLLSTNANNSALMVIISNGVTLRDFNLKVATKPTVRGSNNQTRGIDVDNSSNILIRETRIEQVAGAGIVLYNVATGQVISNEIYNNLADGIHVTGDTSNITVDRNLAQYTGDDSFSSIGYGTSRVNTVSITNNISENSDASGVSVEGTDKATVTNNIIRNSGVAGIRIASIQVWNTTSVTNATVTNNTLDSVRTRCDTDHAAVMIFSDLSNMNTIDFSNNTIINPRTSVGIRSFGINGATVVGESIKNNQFTVNQTMSCNNAAPQAPTPVTMNQCISLEVGVLSPLSSGNTLNGVACQ